MTNIISIDAIKRKEIKRKFSILFETVKIRLKDLFLKVLKDLFLKVITTKENWIWFILNHISERNKSSVDFCSFGPCHVVYFF